MYLVAKLQVEVGEVVMAALQPRHSVDELAQLLSPIASPYGKLLADLVKAVTPLETSVNALAQRLNQVNCFQHALHHVVLAQ